DVVLASQQVGPEGKVIGVDMTPAMIHRARKLAEEMGLQGVEFRLGEIEALPVEDASVDVVVSNCVVNLSPDKPRVFREVHRVLRPWGRMVISDIVLTRELPEQVRTSPEALVACLANAVTQEEYLDTIRAAGLVLDQVFTKQSPQVLEPDSTDPLVRAAYDAVPDSGSLQGVAVSVTIIARKPES
ncbi:MAG: methyltransferase domain-containing protein, partial [Nitrospinota bacterium]